MPIRYCLLLIVALCGVAAAQEQAGRGTSAISGRAIDGLTGRPAAGVDIDLRLFPEKPPEPSPDLRSCGGDDTTTFAGTMRTDAGGRFEFGRVAAGRYTLRTKADGWLPGTYGQQTWNGADRWFELRGSERLTAFEVPVWPAAVLSGSVLDEGGRPLAGTDVRLIPTRPRWIQTSLRTTSDDRGNFTLAVEPGEYLVVAPDWHSFIVGDEDLPRLSSTGMQTHPRTYYPGVNDPAQAQAIAAEAGRPRSDLTIRVPSVPAFNLIAHTTVEIEFSHATLTERRSRDEVAAQRLRPLRDRADRTFTFSGVPVGQYDLLITDLGDKQTFTAAAVEIRDRDVEIRLQRQRAPTVSGSVRWDGTSAPPEVERLNQEFVSICDGEPFPWPRGFRTQSRSAQPFLRGQNLFATRGLTPGRYVVEIPPASSHLTGRVRYERGHEYTRPWVTIIPADQRLWAWARYGENRRVSYVRTSPTGTFVVDLPAGEYFVAVTDARVEPLESHSDFATLAGQARKVAINYGDSTLTDLPVRTAPRR